MRKALFMSVIAVLAIVVPLQAEGKGVFFRFSAIDVDLQYISGEVPLGCNFRCELNAISFDMGLGHVPVMLGMSLWGVSYEGSGYLFSSFLALETIIPLFTWNMSAEGVRFGLLLSAQWAWLLIEPEGRHLEARLEFQLPLIGVYMGTTYFYRESADYRPNLTLGIRLGAMLLGRIDKKAPPDSETSPEG